MQKTFFTKLVSLLPTFLDGKQKIERADGSLEYNETVLLLAFHVCNSYSKNLVYFFMVFVRRKQF